MEDEPNFIEYLNLLSQKLLLVWVRLIKYVGHLDLDLTILPHHILHTGYLAQQYILFGFKPTDRLARWPFEHVYFLLQGSHEFQDIGLAVGHHLLHFRSQLPVEVRQQLCKTFVLYVYLLALCQILLKILIFCEYLINRLLHSLCLLFNICDCLN